MADHSHQAYEVWDVASQGDVSELRSLVGGLREDLGHAEGRIRELERELSDLRREVREAAGS